MIKLNNIIIKYEYKYILKEGVSIIRYEQFHGDIQITEIGRELRKLVKVEKSSFKILTGYGSSTGSSKSKYAALKSLSKMKSEGLIKGYIPGEVKYQLLNSTSLYYEEKMTYGELLKNDSDYGNDGVIFIFK